LEHNHQETISPLRQPPTKRSNKERVRESRANKKIKLASIPAKERQQLLAEEKAKRKQAENKLTPNTIEYKKQLNKTRVRKYRASANTKNVTETSTT